MRLQCILLLIALGVSAMAKHAPHPPPKSTLAPTWPTSSPSIAPQRYQVTSLSCSGPQKLNQTLVALALATTTTTDARNLAIGLQNALGVDFLVAVGWNLADGVNTSGFSSASICTFDLSFFSTLIGQSLAFGSFTAYLWNIQTLPSAKVIPTKVPPAPVPAVITSYASPSVNLTAGFLDQIQTALSLNSSGVADMAANLYKSLQGKYISLVAKTPDLANSPALAMWGAMVTGQFRVGSQEYSFALWRRHKQALVAQQQTQSSFFTDCLQGYCPGNAIYWCNSDSSSFDARSIGRWIDIPLTCANQNWWQKGNVGLVSIWGDAWSSGVYENSGTEIINDSDYAFGTPTSLMVLGRDDQYQSRSAGYFLLYFWNLANPVAPQQIFPHNETHGGPCPISNFTLFGNTSKSAAIQSVLNPLHTNHSVSWQQTMALSLGTVSNFSLITTANKIVGPNFSPGDEVWAWGSFASCSQEYRYYMWAPLPIPQTPTPTSRQPSKSPTQSPSASPTLKSQGIVYNITGCFDVAPGSGLPCFLSSGRNTSMTIAQFDSINANFVAYNFRYEFFYFNPEAYWWIRVRNYYCLYPIIQFGQICQAMGNSTHSKLICASAPNFYTVGYADFAYHGNPSSQYAYDYVKNCVTGAHGRSIQFWTYPACQHFTSRIVCHSPSTRRRDTWQCANRYDINNPLYGSLTTRNQTLPEGISLGNLLDDSECHCVEQVEPGTTDEFTGYELPLFPNWPTPQCQFKVPSSSPTSRPSMSPSRRPTTLSPTTTHKPIRYPTLFPTRTAKPNYPSFSPTSYPSSLPTSGSTPRQFTNCSDVWGDSPCVKSAGNATVPIEQFASLQIESHADSATWAIAFCNLTLCHGSVCDKNLLWLGVATNTYQMDLTGCSPGDSVTCACPTVINSWQCTSSLNFTLVQVTSPDAQCSCASTTQSWVEGYYEYTNLQMLNWGWGWNYGNRNNPADQYKKISDMLRSRRQYSEPSSQCLGSPTTSPTAVEGLQLYFSRCGTSCMFACVQTIPRSRGAVKIISSNSFRSGPAKSHYFYSDDSSSYSYVSAVCVENEYELSFNTIYFYFAESDVPISTPYFGTISPNYYAALGWTPVHLGFVNAKDEIQYIMREATTSSSFFLTPSLSKAAVFNFTECITVDNTDPSFQYVDGQSGCKLKLGEDYFDFGEQDKTACVPGKGVLSNFGPQGVTGRFQAIDKFNCFHQSTGSPGY